MSKKSFPICVLVGIVTFLILIIGVSLLLQMHVKKQAQQDLAATKQFIDTFQKRQAELISLPDSEIILNAADAVVAIYWAS